MTRTQGGQVLATLAIALLAAALPASVSGRPTGSTVTTTVEAKADGPGPCCKSIGLAADLG